MDGESTKFRIKIGALEIEYEGKGSFLQDELFKLVENLVGVYADHRDALPVETPEVIETGGSVVSSPAHLDHSTNTIAAHLSVTTGTELLVAAAARLTLGKKQDKFTRRELDTEMKHASHFYKQNMSSNLSSSLSTLIKANRFNEIGKGHYALSSTERRTLEAKLAQLG